MRPWCFCNGLGGDSGFWEMEIADLDAVDSCEFLLDGAGPVLLDRSALSASDKRTGRWPAHPESADAEPGHPVAS